jgi:hypothetical protein
MKKSDIEIDVDSIAALCDCLDLNPFELTLAQIDILNLTKKRYGKIQRQKTDNTLFLEAQLFKNRMLTLYKALEDKVTSDKTSGTDKAKCAEIAANIAIDVLKMESAGIKSVRELGKQTNRLFNSIQQQQQLRFFRTTRTCLQE